MRRGGKLSVYAAAAGTLLSRRLQPCDVVVDVQTGVPFLSAVHPAAGRGPGPPRAPRAVARRLRPHGREVRLVARVDRGATRLPGVPVRRGLADHQGRAGRPGGPSRRRRSRPQRHGPGSRRRDPAGRDTDRLRARSRSTSGSSTPSGLSRPCATPSPGCGCSWSETAGGPTSSARRPTGSASLTSWSSPSFVSEADKHRALARSWVLAAPSLKEGRGLCVMEAAAHAVPTVAYRNAGGLSESVVDGVTGLLVDDDEDAFAVGLLALLTDDDRRESYGLAAQARATTFTWGADRRVVRPRRLDGRERAGPPGGHRPRRRPPLARGQRPPCA